MSSIHLIYAHMHRGSTVICIQALDQKVHVGYAPRMAETILSKNIAALRSHLAMKQGAFADAVGSDQPNVSKWESKGIVPGTEPLAAMADLAGCSVREFINDVWAPASKTRSNVERLDLRKIASDDTAEIVALDLSLSMGPGTLIEDFVESEPVKMDLGLLQSITRTPSDRLRLVKGIGDSMEPTLRTGDRIMVDINERALARINGIYWVDYCGSHGIKRLRPAGQGRVMIISDNPAVENYEVGTDELRIEGRVIWFAREL